MVIVLLTHNEVLRLIDDELHRPRSDRTLADVGGNRVPLPGGRHIERIGVDLGPNLSVTGSLATVLWLVALRREGEHVSALKFLKLGALIMPVSLVLAIASLFVGR